MSDQTRKIIHVILQVIEGISLLLYPLLSPSQAVRAVAHFHSCNQLAIATLTQTTLVFEVQAKVLSQANIYIIEMFFFRQKSISHLCRILNSVEKLVCIVNK